MRGNLKEKAKIELVGRINTPPIYIYIYIGCFKDVIFQKNFIYDRGILKSLHLHRRMKERIEKKNEKKEGKIRRKRENELEED